MGAGFHRVCCCESGGPNCTCPQTCNNVLVTLSDVGICGCYANCCRGIALNRSRNYWTKNGLWGGPTGSIVLPVGLGGCQWVDNTTLLCEVWQNAWDIIPPYIGSCTSCEGSLGTCLFEQSLTQSVRGASVTWTPGSPTPTQGTLRVSIGGAVLNGVFDGKLVMPCADYNCKHTYIVPVDSALHSTACGADCRESVGCGVFWDNLSGVATVAPWP